MRDLFPHHYSFTEAQLSALWKDALIAVDTNVILNLYRYTEPVANDLFTVLEKLQDRLWLPHQAAFEYQQNRLSVISDQNRKLNEAKQVRGKVQLAAKTAIADLKLRQQHSFISAENFLDAIESATNDFDKYLDGLAAQQGAVPSVDKLRDRIDKLFNGRIGLRPADQSALDAIYASGEKRFVKKQPPGFLDDKEKDKDPPYWLDSLRFERKYGDLIIWEELIAHAKDKGAKHVIFITDEQDEDWWWIAHGKTIGPRRELKEEIQQRAGVELFHMYSSVMFLEYANEHLDATVTEQSIEQVRAVAKEQLPQGERDAYRRAREPLAQRRDALEFEVMGPVSDWLKSLYPGDVVVLNPRFPDFIVKRKTSGRDLGFEVKIIQNIHSADRWLASSPYESALSRTTIEAEYLTVIYIVFADALADYVHTRLITGAFPFGYIIGTMLDDDRFERIYGFPPE